jgi:hypothetical protein
MGEVRAPPVPAGNFAVIDAEGNLVKANAPPKRKKSFVEKAVEVLVFHSLNILVVPELIRHPTTIDYRRLYSEAASKFLQLSAALYVLIGVK